jgi:hypothetical protein
MKLRYIIPSFIAAVAMLVGCSDDFERTFLSDLKVSTSYVSIPAQGGSTEVTVDATADWTIEGNIPEWLTIQPTQGQAGQTKVTFTAPAANGALSAALKIASGSSVQEINIVQGEKVAEEVTIKEACEGADGKTFRVTGAIVRWASNAEKYGNYYIADKTGEIQIYGTADKNGKLQNYPLASWGLELGDEVTVEGGKKTYKDEAELCDVTVIKVKKSLVKILEPTKPDTLDIEGGQLAVTLSFKGKGVIPTVDEKTSWVRYKTIAIKAGIPTAIEQNPADTAVVTFAIEPNAGGDRTSTVSFTCTNGSASSTTSYSFVQKGSILEVPVSSFLAAEVGDTQYRLTGVVTDLYTSDSQGQSFYIKDYSGEALVYRAAGFKESGAKVGDVVTVVGKRGAYNGNPQMTGGTFEKVNYAVTKVTIAELLTKPEDKNTYYMISGTVKDIANAVYGNVTLEQDGAEIYCYGCYPGWGATGDNRKGLFDQLGVAVGDKLTIIGTKSSYNGQVQLANGIFFAYEKAKPADAAGTKEKPFTVAEAFKYIDDGGNDDVYVKGKVSKVQSAFSEKYHTAIFWISDDGVFNDDLTKDFEAYSVYWLGNQEWTEGMGQVEVGDEVVLCGKLTKYTDKNKGTTTYETSSKKAYVYSINGKTE